MFSPFCFNTVLPSSSLSVMLKISLLSFRLYPTLLIIFSPLSSYPSCSLYSCFPNTSQISLPSSFLFPVLLHFCVPRISFVPSPLNRLLLMFPSPVFSSALPCQPGNLPLPPCVTSRYQLNPSPTAPCPPLSFLPSLALLPSLLFSSFSFYSF